MTAPPIKTSTNGFLTLPNTSLVLPSTPSNVGFPVRFGRTPTVSSPSSPKREREIPATQSQFHSQPQDQHQHQRERQLPPHNQPDHEHKQESQLQPRDEKLFMKARAREKNETSEGINKILAKLSYHAGEQSEARDGAKRSRRHQSVQIYRVYRWAGLEQ
jgi:hypothetical protein